MQRESTFDFDQVYPALFSHLASAFRKTIQPEYSGTFSGQEAVDCVCSILQTADRNLALLVCRSLEEQGLFKHISGAQKTRDTPHELYILQSGAPTGVFTMLTECYSPTCESGCYSISCPRKLFYLNLANTAPAVKETEWALTVPPTLLASLTKNEISRQNAIYELIETEKEYVADLQNTIAVFVQPILRGNVIPQERRRIFVDKVFSNMQEIAMVNAKLLRRLIARQNDGKIVEKIGDIFLSAANDFTPYFHYGSQQVFAKSVLDEEKRTNAEFAKFLKAAERSVELRKLSIETFLAKPTTRLGRYLLLLKPVTEKAHETSPDRLLVPQAVGSIRDILSQLNVEVGKSDNKLKLSQLEKKISPGDIDKDDLKLLEAGRKLVRDGKLMMRKTASDIEINVFLFDHLIMFARAKDHGYKIIRLPIPLDLLSIKIEKITPGITRANTMMDGRSRRKSLPKNTSLGTGSNMLAESARAFPLTFIHLGRNGSTFVLFASSEAVRQSWVNAIQQEQALVFNSTKKFDLVPLSLSTFINTIKVHCCTSYQKKLVVGTDYGLYVGPESPGSPPEIGRDKAFKKVLDLEKITQLDFLVNYDVLLILAGFVILIQIVLFTHFHCKS